MVLSHFHVVVIEISLIIICTCLKLSNAFYSPAHITVTHALRLETFTVLSVHKKKVEEVSMNRRKAFTMSFVRLIVGGSSPLITNPAFAANLTPGKTLVEYEIGPQIGNSEASPSRQFDNSNVLFSQDYYYKFGTAPPWIEPDSTEFPKTMPFTLSQKRYDSLKKYGTRVSSAGYYLENVVKDAISSGDYANKLSDPNTDPSYCLRPMGLLANSFLASENTGTTNELFLARWYINEISLDMNDIRMSESKDIAIKSYKNANKAYNSYLSLMNRLITSKVGDKFGYI